MRKPNRFEVGKRIKSVTPMPGIFLRFQGARNAKDQEPSVPEKRIEGLMHSCAEIEKGEALFVEKQLKKVRNDGAAALAAIDESNKKIEENTQLLPEDTPEHIRENQRRKAIVAQAKLDIKNAEQTLMSARQALINADMILSQRILKTRDKAHKSKISAYVRGVRTKIPGYSPKCSFSNTAYDTYRLKNEVTDNAIISYASKILERVV